MSEVHDIRSKQNPFKINIDLGLEVSPKRIKFNTPKNQADELLSNLHILLRCSGANRGGSDGENLSSKANTSKKWWVSKRKNEIKIKARKGGITPALKEPPEL